MILTTGSNGRLVAHIQEELGIVVDGQFGPITHAAVCEFQGDSGLAEDGLVGINTMAKLFPEKQMSEKRGVCLAKDDLGRLAYRKIGVFEAGGKWNAMNRNFEYEGRFDHPGDLHWASKYGDTPTFIGLSAGLLQATEKSGTLGRVLALIDKKNRDGALKIFGNQWDIIVDGTNGQLKKGDDEITINDQDVGTIYVLVPQHVVMYDEGWLWQQPLVGKMRRLFNLPAAREAQMEVALRWYYEPAVEFCHEYDLFGSVAITMTTERFNGHGPSGALRLLRHLFAESRGWDEEARMLWVWHFAEYHTTNRGWPIRFGKYLDAADLSHEPVMFGDNTQ